MSGEKYLAVIMVMGSGSLARDSNRDKAIARVKRIFKSDFRGILKMTPGSPVVINICECEGRSVEWDDSGFRDSETGESLAHTVEYSTF